LRGDRTLSGTKQIARRIINAETEFIQNVIDRMNCSILSAEKVLRIYRKEKIVKLDPIMGRYNLKHGVFWDKDVLKNTINF